MAKILLIANYKPSVGGISGQVEISLEYFLFICIQFFKLLIINVKFKKYIHLHWI